jgi:hypothetical protein
MKTDSQKKLEGTYREDRKRTDLSWLQSVKPPTTNRATTNKKIIWKRLCTYFDLLKISWRVTEFHLTSLVDSIHDYEVASQEVEEKGAYWYFTNSGNDHVKFAPWYERKEKAKKSMIDILKSLNVSTLDLQRISNDSATIEHIKDELEELINS